MQSICGGKGLAAIRKGYETARCPVFRWGLGGQKNAMTFFLILYHHIQTIGGGRGGGNCNDIFFNSLSTHTNDWGLGGQRGRCLGIHKLYEIARC